MKPRKLTLSIVTAAALAAFGAVNAHDANTDPNASVDPAISAPADSVSSSASSPSYSESESMSSLPSEDSNANADDAHAGETMESQASPSASVDSVTDEERLESGSDRVAGYYGGYAPESSGEDLGRN